jgi:hypothetical protein
LLLPIRSQELFITVPLTVVVFAALAVGLRVISTTDLIALRSLLPRRSRSAGTEVG